MARMLLLVEAEEERLRKMLTLRRRQLREDSLPMLLPEQTFVDTFRLGKNHFRALSEDLMPFLHPLERTTAIKLEIKILAALQFYASGSYQRSVGNDFSLGLSQTSVSDCLAEVTDALNQPQILRKYITSPRTANERSAVARRFSDRAFTLLSFDLRIMKKHSIYNRTMYHSLNVLVIIVMQIYASYMSMHLLVEPVMTRIFGIVALLKMECKDFTRWDRYSGSWEILAMHNVHG